ncbi:hypothetical protein ACJ41O_006250 [Fusarium nematophilum]
MASNSAKEGSNRDSLHEERRDNAGDSEVPEVQSDNGSSNDHVWDKKAVPVAGKREKLKRHCLRFRWWYLIGLLVFLAILLPILFKVIVPAIIQSILNSQKLPITSGALQALSPTHVNMTLRTSLNTPLGVKLDPVDLYLYNKNDQPVSSFFTLRLPELHIHHRTDVVVTNQTIRVTNETELLTWFNEFFDKPRVELSLQGSPKIHLGALEYKRSLDKTIEIPSLTYLDGFGVRDMEFMLQTNRTGHNMKGLLNIPNSGVLTLGLGNLTFNLMSGETRLGLINLYDVQLRPGNNSVPFDGDFFFQELVPNLATILDSQKEALGHGYFEFNATGNATIVNGEHINYIEGVLNNKHLGFTIPVITILSDVVGGMLGADQGSLLDIFGGAIGNSTLFEHLLDHWDADGQEGDGTRTAFKGKRANAGRSWMWNILRLGLRAKSK